MSYEEKRQTMMKIFLETQDFWSMKELEKMGSKRGVGRNSFVPSFSRRCFNWAAVSQTIQEIVKSLVDDDMVRMEKIGSGNFYFAFSSAVGQKRKVRTHLMCGATLIDCSLGHDSPDGRAGW